MPYINSKVTVKLSDEKKKALKEGLGKIITDFPGKSETFLMVGFEDEYSLFFGGKELEYGAFVEVKILGKSTKEIFSNVTKDICELFEKELNIPGNAIYVKYEEVEHWGYNGSNF